MSKIIDQSPPNHMLIECPVTKPAPWMLQRASCCASLNDGNPCPHFGGLVDGSDDLIEQFRHQALSQQKTPAEAMAYAQAMLFRIEYHERFRVCCKFPTMRRMQPVAGEGV